MSEIRNVAIIGAGTMGHSLAQVFAQGGYNVWLNDVKDEIVARAKKLIASNLDTLIELGNVEKSQKEPILRRIHTTVKLEEAGQNADFVIEAIIEDQAAKKEIFSRLDKTCPSGAILASNTSYMDIFKFVETKRPDKVLITHWFAPPHIVPLVEIVRGPRTSQEVVDRVKALMIQVGKKPIVITKFLPGFIANRLQSALGNEVFNLLDQGYASPEDIDTATKASFALRMPILGLVKRMDFAGLDLTQKILSNQTYKVPPQNTKSKTVERLVSQGKLGVKTGSGYYEYGGRSTEEIMKERDMKLIKLREFLKEMGEL
ncbi:MAG TPA: 3-hydroxyacyl-CoA dehydrogenase family protein [Thermodesulfobacteriota bacterium]|nr:3-hydroxyacyl-CoA dehydrogenase family protein [Thermodesulfobacteriota bacterium]